jgi:hypothetical protein
MVRSHFLWLIGALARDEELQEKLWTFSEKLMNEKVKV